jgi:hypothetical protein
MPIEHCHVHSTKIHIPIEKFFVKPDVSIQELYIFQFEYIMHFGPLPGQMQSKYLPSQIENECEPTIWGANTIHLRLGGNHIMFEK